MASMKLRKKMQLLSKVVLVWLVISVSLGLAVRLYGKINPETYTSYHIAKGYGNGDRGRGYYCFTPVTGCSYNCIGKAKVIGKLPHPCGKVEMACDGILQNSCQQEFGIISLLGAIFRPMWFIVKH